MMAQGCDFLIVGAGIVGLTCALEIRRREPASRIIVLEKERSPGRHSSGRNSGVLHSGIYYPPGTLKARVCGEGARRMAQYCEDRGLPINRIGKLLIPTRRKDGDQLNLLYLRGAENDVEIERIDAAALARMEPETRSATGEALFVPTTAVVDSSAVLASIVKDATDAGITMLCGGALSHVDHIRRTAHWGGERIAYGHAVNTSGLHADSVARQFGLHHDLRLLPFKGIYWKLAPEAGLKINHLIYPVPDLRVPFLGIHTTTAIDGTVYLGPTSVPAFGREHYAGVKGIDRDLPWIVGTLASQFAAGRDGFRRLALQEGPRYLKRNFVEAARRLLPRLASDHLRSTDKVGIRAQMLNLSTRQLVTDFVVRGGPSSTHVLNAISPAFTSAFPLAEIICDQIFQLEQLHANQG